MQAFCYAALKFRVCSQFVLERLSVLVLQGIHTCLWKWPYPSVLFHQDLLDPARWKMLIQQFRYDNYRLHQLGNNSVFTITLQAGLSAIKTPYPFDSTPINVIISTVKTAKDTNITFIFLSVEIISCKRHKLWSLMLTSVNATRRTGPLKTQTAPCAVNLWTNWPSHYPWLTVPTLD